MLVLSRKVHESVVIDDDITVTIVDILADKVRLGIQIPKGLSVYRKEIYDATHGRVPASDPPPLPLHEEPNLGDMGDPIQSSEPTAVELSPRQASFVKRIYTDLTN